MDKLTKSLDARLPDTVSIGEACEVFSQIMGFFRECEITKRETARYDALVKILTTEINRKYELLERVFTEVFSERRAGILKTFEVIDRGMETNDKQMINLGLMGLSSIVASSPFAGMSEMVKAISAGQTISI
jgi:hypothetical protein